MKHNDNVLKVHAFLISLLILLQVNWSYSIWIAECLSKSGASILKTSFCFNISLGDLIRENDSEAINKHVLYIAPSN